jgi:mevalonate kinase
VVVSGQRVEGTRHVFDATLTTPEGDREWSINVVDLPPDMEEAWLVIGFTGEASPTGKIVAGVAQRLKEEPALEKEMDAIAKITHAGLTALSAGNLEAVGMAMDACHQKLRLLGVSSPSLEALVEAARPHALGAKLTGAGGGGCMVALAREPQRVAEAIEVAGGMPLISRLGASGVHLL